MLEIIKLYISSIILLSTLYISVIIINGANKKRNLLMIITLILLFSILHTIIYAYTDTSFKTILICFLYSSFISLMFKLKISKSIFISIIYIILLMIPDLITLGGALYIFGVSKEYYYSYLAGGIICNISVNVLMIALIYSIRKPLRKLINYNITTNKKIILVSSLTLVSLAIFFYSLIKTFEFDNNIISYLIVILTLIVILILLFKQKIDNETVIKRYDELLDIMKNYESDIEEQRTILHEVKNEIMTIKSKIKDKEKEQAIIKYIDSILGDKITVNMTKYSKFKYLPSNGLKGFFYYKFIQAEKNKINVSVNISRQIENCFLNNLEVKVFKDLVRIIGVYLDNAIEASKESKDRKLGIEIYLIDKQVKIIISNTYNGNIDENKIGKEKFSTKGKNRGHGLLLVRRILHENNIFESHNRVTDKLYIQELIVKDIKK